MRYVITHPDMGIYLGSWLGLGFWSMLDAAGQTHAVTFSNKDDAISYISTWKNNNDPLKYNLVPVDEDCLYVGVDTLSRCGLEHQLGEMTSDS